MVLCLWNFIGPKQISFYAPAWMVRRGVYYMQLDRPSVFLFVYLFVCPLFLHAWILRLGGYTAAKCEL